MLTRMTNGFGLGGTLSPLLRLPDDMNRLFEEFFEDMPSLRPYGRSFPALNSWEDGDAAYVEAELPGLGMGDIEVLVSGNDVTINGRRTIASPEGATWHRRERSHGEFSRMVTLPWAVDADKVEAKFRDGVLTVTLPKSETHKPKRVKVHD